MAKKSIGVAETKRQKKPREKRAPMQTKTCPCCKKSCPLSKPKCSKGKKLASKLGLR